MPTVAGRFGPYRLGPLLGRGGMGEVYRAQDGSQGGRAVALKVLTPHLSQDLEYRARFRRECEIAARLDEPHIVPIHRYGEIDDRLFLDMQLVDGPDLAAVLLRDGPLHPARAIAVVAQVAAALDAAHAAGLVHRDVKPSNVLLVSPGHGREVALLTDFGIALGRPEGLGGTGDGHGTAEYLAPERILNRPADHRVDVYALACVLFELLTGLRAFPGGEFAAQAHGHLHLRPPRPSEVVAGLPPALDGVIARGMAKDPARRYPSAGALAQDARAAVRAEPRTVGRRRLLVGAAAVGGLAVVGGGAALLLTGSGPPQPVVTERALAVRVTGLDPFAVVGVGPLIVLPDPDYQLVFWDIVADRGVGVGFPGASLSAVGFVELGGRPVMAIRNPLNLARNVIVANDILTGDSLGARLTDPSTEISAMATASIAGRPVVVTVGADQVLRRRHLDDGSEFGPPLQPTGENAGLGLRTVQAGGRPAFVQSGTNGVEVLDLETFERIGGTPRFESAVVDLDGRPVALDVAQAVTVTDVATEEPIRSIPAAGASVLTAAVVDGRATVVTDDLDDALVMYDLRTGEQVGAPMTGHQAEIVALGVVDVAGRPVLVSASRDQTVRIWDLAVRAAAP